MSADLDAAPDPPEVCMCSHSQEQHPWGPCLAKLCGCGWWRPDTRREAGARD